MFIIKRFLVLVILIFSFSACGNQQKTSKQGASKVEKSELSNKVQTESVEVVDSKKTLLFFLNPHGRPCQMQEEIIDKIMPHIKDKVTVE